MSNTNREDKTMNTDTKEIANILNITIEDALQVHNTIDKHWMLRWSECTQAEFERAVFRAYDIVKA